MSEPVPSFLKSPTFKGILPWVMVFLALVVVQRSFDYRIVNAGRDLAGLEDNTLYSYSTTPALCVNEAVYFSREARRHLVTIGAVAGQRLSDAERDELIGLQADTLGALWEAVAYADVTLLDLETVPEGHVLLINTGFQAEDERHGWALTVVPSADIQASLSHVLFSRNFTRIGQPAKKLGECLPQA